MVLTMSFKVSSVVDTATGRALDYTVDSLTITGEKLEVKLEMLMLFTVKSVVLSTSQCLCSGCHCRFLR